MQMRYCPYCGAGPIDSTHVFCLECGKQIPEKHAQPASVEKEERKSPDKKGKKKRTAGKGKRIREPVETVTVPEEDGYDGYYDDIQPVDLGKVKQGIDKEMLKRIIGLLAGVVIIICGCIAIMYLL